MRSSEPRAAAADGPHSFTRFTSENPLRVFVLGVAFFVGASACAGRAAHAQQARPVAATLAPGDVIRIGVWRRPELSGDFQIALDGTIVHPLYRHITAAGVAMPQLESRIRTFLLQFEANPEFVISPLFRVFVAGEVKQPTALTVPPGTTIAQAIALAGGPTEDARLDRVRLFRDLQATMLDLTSGDSTVASLELRSNDQIMVTRQHSVFRDVLVPTITVLGGLSAIANVVLISTRHH